MGTSDCSQFVSDTRKPCSGQKSKTEEGTVQVRVSLLRPQESHLHWDPLEASHFMQQHLVLEPLEPGEVRSKNTEYIWLSWSSAQAYDEARKSLGREAKVLAGSN